MTLPQDPASLSRLRDIVEPEAIGIWPLAPGWWVVIAALAATAAVFARAAQLRWRANAYRRAALAELDQLPSDQVATRLPALVKRTALAAYPRRSVAQLSGAAWLSFLDETGGTDAFTNGPGRALASLAYAKDVGTDGDHAALLQVARSWIQNHRPAGPAC